MKKITLTLIAALCCIVSFAQTGLTCNDAIPETANTTCIYTTYITTTTDIWFSFTATSPFAQISLIGADFGDFTSSHIHNITMFEGTCTNLNKIEEDELPFIDIAEELIIDASGLTVGDTYYLRARREGAAACPTCVATGSPSAEFDLCIQSIEVFQPLDFNLVDFGFPELPASGHTYYTNRGQIIDHDLNPRRDIKLYTIHSSPAIFITDNTLSYVFSVSDTIPSGDTIPNTLITGQRIDMKLVGGNPNTRAFKTEKTSGHLNFFLNHIPTGITKMKGYSKVVCNGIYSDIDMQYYSNSEGLKYYFIIHPGGNGDDIILRFDGANSVDVTGVGRLKLSTDYGEMFFDAGHAYQINPGNNVVPMPWQAKFEKVSANEVKFDIRNYPKHMPLIIQVDRGHQFGTTANSAEWLSHLGGTDEDKIFAAAADDQGSIYYIGQTKSANFPVSPGAFQDTLITTFNNSDAFIAAFDFEYRPKFITYLGGGLPDWGNSISWSSTNGMLYIAGETRGGPNDLGLNFPSRNLGGNSYFDSLYSSGSMETGFIGRMDTASGIPDWLSYFGSDTTHITKIAHDAAGNMYLVGVTRRQKTGNSTTCNNPPNNGFPLCNLGGTAYYQDFHAGGSGTNTAFDGFFSKFSETGELLHSSYFGGSGDDFIYDIAIDNIGGAAYIIGSTNSQRFSAPACSVPTDGSFPICFPGGGYSQGTLNLGTAGTQQDAFVAKFDLTTLELLRSTYFGTDTDDVATGIAINSLGEKYIVGHTKTFITGSPLCDTPTNQGFPSCPALNTFSDFSFGQEEGYKKFFSKFDVNDDLVLSRAIKGSAGGEGDIMEVVAPLSLISPRIAINTDDQVFVIGTTWDPFLDVGGFTSNFYSQQFHGDIGAIVRTSDVFVALFRSDNIPTTDFVTFIGGTGNQTNPITGAGDIGLAIATYLNTRVYIGGFTYSNAVPFPTKKPATPSGIPYWQPNCVNCGSGKADAFVGQIQAGIFTGVEESAFDNNTVMPFIVYPNPANNEITLKFDVSGKTDVNIRIYNIVGETVYNENQKYNTGTFKKQIDLSRYSNGMYLIQVVSEQMTNSIKVIKQ